MKKTISVAIATYNGGHYLKEQLNSIYHQDLIPDEVVVSDDGSTDNTLEILEEFHQIYGLTYSQNPGEHGVNNNFYRAISLCSKDIIAISDQDDIWLPNKLSTSLVKLLELDNSKPACVSSLCNHIDKDGNITKESKADKDTFGYAATLLTYGKHQVRSQGCSLMFNRELANLVLNKITKYPEIKTTMFYDGFISFTAAITGSKYNLGKRLMLYRHHSTNVLAVEGIKSPGIFERIRNNVYYKFIPNIRLKKMPMLLNWFTENEFEENALLLCKKISKISKGPIYWGLLDIMTIKELSIIRKLEIFFGTLAMGIIKLFIVKHPNA